MAPTKPLTIWVHPRWAKHPAICELETKGHTIVDMGQPGPWAEPDLILHPSAWRWNEELWKYIDITIKEARRAKYPPDGVDTPIKPRKNARHPARPHEDA